MENKFKYSNDNKRYHTFSYHLKQKYGCKVAKVSLNAGFTCPNRDGKKGYGGCIFCSSSGSGDFAGKVEDHLMVQFDKVSAIMKNKWPNCKFMAYFQANTNTYGSLEEVKACIEPFLHSDQVIAIAIATRPDCLPDDIVEYLGNCNKIKDVWIELGLQSIHEKTSNFINRGHTYDEFLIGLKKLRQVNLPVCVHVMNGLPYETVDMMLETVKVVAREDIQAIKIHMLYVIEGTKLGRLYHQKPFEMLTRDQYIDLVVEQLTYIPENIVIERLTGDANIDDLIVPNWSIKKVTILNDIDKQLASRNLMQGCNIKK